MIDLHCHALPGVDDGPATVEAAIALARVARQDGITTIAATPHVEWSRPSVTSGRIRAAVPALQSRLAAAGVDVTIVPGAELAAGRALELDDAELRALSLGGAGSLLLECPLTATLTPGFVDAARALARRGFRIVLAHPERSPIFLRSPETLLELVAEGMLAQITAGAASGHARRGRASMAPGRAGVRAEVRATDLSHGYARMACSPSPGGG